MEVNALDGMRNLGGGDPNGFKEEDLETWRVLLFIFFVVIFVEILEHVLHHIDRVCKAHPKYAKMLHKTTQELMIVGLIYMVVKFCVYSKIAMKNGPVYYAMDAADLFVFFVTMALIFQAIIVFIRLRKSNIQMDKLSIMKAADLLTLTQIKMEESKSKSLWQQYRVWHKYEDRMEMKILGQFFLDVYKLPQLFSFSKYIREVQDSRITKLIEIDLSTWIMLLGVFTLYFVCTDEMDKTYRVTESSVRLLTFGIFVSVHTFTMICFYLYLKRLVTILLEHASNCICEASPLVYDKSNKMEFLYEAMNNVILSETSDIGDISTEEAIEEMRIVADGLYNEKKKKKNCFKIDLLCQWIYLTYCKYINNKKNRNKNTLRYKLLNKKQKEINLPYFSHKISHIIMQCILILNGFFYALLINCILYVTGWNILILFLLFLPLLLNTFLLAPNIIHQFSILNGTWRVGRKKLSSVIEHFAQVEKMKQRMCIQIYTYLNENNKNLNDLKNEFQNADSNTITH